MLLPPLQLGYGTHVSVYDGDQRSYLNHREINMATNTLLLKNYGVVDSALHENALPCPIGMTLKFGVSVYCWFRGFTKVSGKQVQIAQTLAFHVDDEEPLDLEAVTEIEDENSKVPVRRVNRARRAPFASWLVQTIRGAHLSQCLRTEANVLVFERHARALMAEHGVRPTDAARVLPFATALFFDHRSVDQIDAVAITQAASFKTSRSKYVARYFSWGRVALLEERA